MEELLTEIAGYSRTYVLTELRIKPSTLREWQWILNQLQPKGWDYQPYDDGFSNDAVNVLKAFKRLTTQRSRKFAIKAINQLMEAYYGK